MKKLWMSLRRQEGFTLVELMVVVAIIGLLSAVAIPNFKKYQAKSKVSEAKLALSAVYMAQTTFFSDFNVFAGCLSYMGYFPAPEVATRYYSVGFNVATNVPASAYSAASNAGLIVTDCSQNIAAASASNNYFVAGRGAGSGISDNTHLTLTAFDSTAGLTFIAGAAGVIEASKTAAGQSSALTVDEQKKILNRRDGY
jgi:type IV pilus assembly protein PilA